MKTLSPEPAKVGKRGTVVIAPKFREEYGLEEGQPIIMEATPHGVLIKSSTSVPVRRYTAEEKAEFILRAALTRAEYDEAIREVKALGVDPKSIPHRPPK